MLTITRTATGHPRPIRITRGGRTADAIIGHMLARDLNTCPAADATTPAKGGAR